MANSTAAPTVGCKLRNCLNWPNVDTRVELPWISIDENRLARIPSTRIDFPSMGNPLALKFITNVFKIHYKSILMDSHRWENDSHRPPCHSHGFPSMKNRWRCMEFQPGKACAFEKYANLATLGGLDCML